MLRLPIVVAVAALALAAGTAFAAGSRAQSSARLTVRSADTVTVWVKVRGGSWRKSLSLRLRKTKLSVFYVCASYGKPLAARDVCESAETLPTAGTFLRIEQSPIKKAQRRPDSPGWGLVGMGDTKVVQAELSNLVTGDSFGTFKYRATLRTGDGKVLGSSSRAVVSWHR